MSAMHHYILVKAGNEMMVPLHVVAGLSCKEEAISNKSTNCAFSDLVMNSCCHRKAA